LRGWKGRQLQVLIEEALIARLTLGGKNSAEWPFAQKLKVFCFFFSKKKDFLLSLKRKARNP